jgi:hypothetical protein
METSESSQTKVRVFRRSSTQSNGEKDFMILCPAVAENSGVIEALYALFYLPQNYKLLISAAGAKSKTLYAKIKNIIRSESLMNRVVLQEETGMSEMAAPFLEANVVVYGSSDPMYIKDSPQAIVVFDIASKLMSLNGNHNFAVATSTPESLASAILSVARNQR